jgi:hypothetical protein
MLRWIFALGLVFVCGCASGNGVDPCERALQRLVDDCNDEINVDSLDLHCTGQAACVAGCLETSPCADIGTNSGEFYDCTAACTKS